jgi:hypothetical protein
VGKSKSFFQALKLYTGLTDSEVQAEIVEKQRIIEYLVRQRIMDVDSVGRIIAEYYTNKENLLRYVKADKPFIEEGREEASRDKLS